MDKSRYSALLQAKDGKEREVEAFLKSAQPLAEAERVQRPGTRSDLGRSKFGIFDTFKSEDGTKCSP